MRRSRLCREAMRIYALDLIGSGGQFRINLPDFVDDLAVAESQHITYLDGVLTLEHDVGSDGGAFRVC